jgi:hypothetical protein
VPPKALIPSPFGVALCGVVGEPVEQVAVVGDLAAIAVLDDCQRS